jgi:preprotein translocase subunit SecE
LETKVNKGKKMASPAEFVRQVKQEAKKVSWPSRAETWKATFLILIMVVAFCGFFFAVDYVISYAIDLILGLNLVRG